MTNKSNKKKPVDYEVGYGKPPKHSQFVKGETGNPLGRAGKKTDLDAAIVKQLLRKITITEGGEQKRLRIVDALAMRIALDATKGKPSAIREVKASIKRRMDIEEAERAMIDSDMSDDEIYDKLMHIIDHARARQANHETRQERIAEDKRKADEQIKDDEE